MTNNSVFKLIIAGGRDFNNKELVRTKVIELCEEGELKERAVQFVCGMARGADMTGHQVVTELGGVVHEFPANWAAHGRGAGFARNTDMAHFADGLLAFWDGKSKGTAHMIETMRKMGKPIWVVMYE